MVGRGRAWSIGESRARHNGGGRCLSEWNETERVCIVRRRDMRSYRILMTRVTLAYLGGLTRPSTHVMLSPWKTIHGLPPSLPTMASSGEIALPLPLCRRSFHSYESYLGIWNIDGRVEGANNKYFSTIRVVTNRPSSRIFSRGFSFSSVSSWKTE